MLKLPAYKDSKPIAPPTHPATHPRPDGLSRCRGEAELALPFLPSAPAEGSADRPVDVPPACCGTVGFLLVGSIRQCSRSACQRSAVATLTYVYADSTAVLGPMATYAEPHTYDLCALHAGRLTVPRGWEVVRLTLPSAPPEHNSDDLLALADAVREAAVDRSAQPAAPVPRGTRPPIGPALDGAGPRRGHLRILREH